MNLSNAPHIIRITVLSWYKSIQTNWLFKSLSDIESAYRNDSELGSISQNSSSSSLFDEKLYSQPFGQRVEAGVDFCGQLL